MSSPGIESKAQTVSLMTLAAVAIGGALFLLRTVLVPFLLALFFVCGIAPILDYFEKRLNTPRIVAVVIAFLLGLLLTSLLWAMVWVSVASLASDADVYRVRLTELVGKVSAFIGEDEAEFAAAGRALGKDAEDTETASESESDEAGPVAGKDPAADDEGPDPQMTVSDPNAERLDKFLGEHFRMGLGQLSAALMDLLSSGLIVLIFMFFLLLGGSAATEKREGVWFEIESQIRNYIVTKAVISLFTGGLFGLVLWLFGIPLAFVFGVLAFLLNFIPNVGPVIASLLPMPLIFLNPDLSLVSMLTVATLAVVIQFASGNIAEPKIMGDSFELHPVAILLTLMFWGMIWGIVGMFLATPITAATKILLEKFELTRPIAELLAGHLTALPDMDDVTGAMAGEADSSGS